MSEGIPFLLPLSFTNNKFTNNKFTNNKEYSRNSQSSGKLLPSIIHRHPFHAETYQSLFLTELSQAKY